MREGEDWSSLDTPIPPPPLLKKKKPIKKIFLASIIFLLIILPLIFFYSKSTHPFNQYKVSLIHNGEPITIGSTGLSHQAFTYEFVIYNGTPSCGGIITFNGIQASNYTLDGNYRLNGKSLKDIEGGTFDLDLDAQSSDITRDFSLLLRPEDSYSRNESLYFQELPKLSENFSLTVDIPFINNSESSFFIKNNGSHIITHIEMLDEWEKDNDFICRLARPFEASDVNISNCSNKIGLFDVEKHCVRWHSLDCFEIVDTVILLEKANRNGKNIDCTVPLNKLSSGKEYRVKFFVYDKVGEHLYSIYESPIAFLGSIKIP